MDIVKQLRLLQQIYDQGSDYDVENDLHLHPIPSDMTQGDLEALAACGRSPNEMIRPGHGSRCLGKKRRSG